MQKIGRIWQNLKVSVNWRCQQNFHNRKECCCCYSQESKNTAIRKAKANMLFGQFIVLITGETVTVNKAETNEMAMEKEQGVKLYMRLSIIWECEHEQVLWCPLLTSKHFMFSGYIRSEFNKAVYCCLAAEFYYCLATGSRYILWFICNPL